MVVIVVIDGVVVVIGLDGIVVVIDGIVVVIDGIVVVIDGIVVVIDGVVVVKDGVVVVIDGIVVVIDGVVGIRVHDIGGSSLHSPDGKHTISSLPSSAYSGKQLNMATPPTVDLVITFTPFSGVSKVPHTTTERDKEHKGI